MEVISVSNVSKKYKLYHDKKITLKEKILFRKKNKYEELWVLKNINLDITKGTTVGLIGKNGSGKSTLLKLLTKIIYPDKGNITIKGRVSSLLELGAGFHPDMTGIENIYTNASIFGLTKKEIDKKLEDIIAFSELQEFIDSPVRTYSSGMYMRLAFSVAINVEPDILLIDEILAVGDTNFQKKCMSKIKELKNKGVTIVIVSHDLGSIEKICDRSVWLNEGKIMIQGNPRDVIANYREFLATKENERLNIVNQSIACDRIEEIKEEKIDEKKDKEKNDNIQEVKLNNLEQIALGKTKWGTKEIDIYDVKMVDLNGKEKSVFVVGEPAEIKIYYKKQKPFKDIVFGISIHTEDGLTCYGTNTYLDKIRLKYNDLSDNGYISIFIKELNLIEGTYYIDIASQSEDEHPYDWQLNRYIFSTVSETKDVGVCRLQHEWIIK